MKTLLKNRAVQWAMVLAMACAVGLFIGGCGNNDNGGGADSDADAHAGQEHGDMASMAEEAAGTATEAVAGTEQTICPVMGNAIDKTIFVEHEGKKVYFCCPPCKEKFTANPEDYLAKLPQFKQ